MHFDTPSNFVPAGQSARYQNKVNERIWQPTIWKNLKQYLFKVYYII